MTKYLTIDDIEVRDKVVLVRVDFNSEIDLNTKKVSSLLKKNMKTRC